jgi:cell division protein ZapA
MTDENNLISVKLLDREYSIRCPENQEQSLQEAARYLDEQMQVVRQSGTITSADRVAIVAALNLTHELFQLRKQKSQYVDEVRDRVQTLQNKIENFLAAEEELTV